MKECVQMVNLCCKINKLNIDYIHDIMINKNASSCNRAISFESIFTYIGISTLLGKAKLKKRSGTDVFTILNVLISSVFKGYPNLFRFFESTEGKSCSFSRDAAYRFLSNPKYDWQSF